MIAGRYRIAAAIGRGGMGEVYRARDEVLGRQVAVKLVRPASGPLTAADRFLREARATARIRDPRVVTAYDYGRDGDWLYLAMELVSGRTVSDELKACGPLSVERAMHVVRQAAVGLAAAHRLGVVHRDVKPGNLLLTDDGSVKVADFGIVRFVDEGTTTLTSTRQIVGTSQYLAPERALGEPAEPASDIYALGCVLYQLVTGHPPFVGDDPAAIMYQHVDRPPVPPREVRPDLPDEIEALILWMLAKDPARRPTAMQVATGARPPLSLSGEDIVDTAVLAVRRPTGKRVLAGAAATVALVASAAAAILLTTRGIDLPATTDLVPATTPSSAPRSTSPATPTTPVPTVSRTATVSAEHSGPQAKQPQSPAKTKPAPKTAKPGHGATHGKSKADKPGKSKKHRP